jgi:predicted nucleotidyltransferase
MNKRLGHRLVRDTVKESDGVQRVKAHCACGKWTYDVPVSPDRPWQGELNQAYRDHCTKNVGLKRESIKRALAGLLKRVEQANSNPDFYCSIGAVVLFGSCLTSKQRPKDVDIAIKTLNRLPRSTSEEVALRDKSYTRPHPRFRNLVEEVEWPTEEVKRFVKGGKRMFSIHDLSDLDQLKAPYRVLYGDPTDIAKEVGYEPFQAETTS